MRHLQCEFEVSERRACRTVKQHRSVQRREPVVRDENVALVKRMHSLVQQHPRFGYRRIWSLLRRDGFHVNQERVYRLWRQEGLKVRRRRKRKRGRGSSKNSCHRQRSRGINDVWAWDFSFNYTRSGTQLKWLSIVDEFTRECLALKVSRRMTSEDVIDTLCELFAQRGVPRFIRSDNGPEFVSKAIENWLHQTQVTALYVQPGSPWENGYAESFISKLRDEFFNVEEFETVRDSRALTKRFQESYNHERPHSGLNYLTPMEFATSAQARQKGAAPSTVTVASTSAES